MTINEIVAKLGQPSPANEPKYMALWVLPADLQKAFAHVKGISAFPKKVYCNKHIVAPLEKALRNLIAVGLASELKTWDGVYHIRPQRGATVQSTHSWGLAVDVNAAENALGATPKLSKEFVKCFIDAGFLWGGNFKNRKDGMHFELAKF